MGSAKHLLVLLCTLSATPALAQPDQSETRQRARDLATQATVAYNVGDYDEAAELYEAAYRQFQDPALLYNLGQAYRLAGRHDKALAAYKGYLRTSAEDDPNRRAASTRVTELEKAIADAKRATPPAAVEPAPVAEPAAAPPAPAPAPLPPASAPVPPAPAASSAPTTPPPTVATTPRPTVVTAPPVVATPAPPPQSTLRTGAGGHIAFSGHSGDSAVNFLGYGRLEDNRRRSVELGFVRRAVYPMNPTFQYSSVYGGVGLPNGWRFELGALGAAGAWHLGVLRTIDPLTLGFRLERIDADDLCGVGDTNILYTVPEAHIRVPVSARFSVAGSAIYRGKLAVTSGCKFHPSQMSLALEGQLALTPAWALMTGVGHHALFDLGPTAPAGWGGRDGSVGQFLLRTRYRLGRTFLQAHYRFLAYAGGTSELLFGAEFFSSPEPP